jgi:cephalosporin-C deacetylase
MMFDLPLDQLREYRPVVAEPDDFDDFWTDQRERANALPLDATFAPIDSVIRSSQVYDVAFSGHGGTRVRGWLLVPRDLDDHAPVIVEFVGYGGGRGLPTDWLTLLCGGLGMLFLVL